VKDWILLRKFRTHARASDITGVHTEGAVMMEMSNHHQLLEEPLTTLLITNLPISDDPVLPLQKEHRSMRAIDFLPQKHPRRTSKTNSFRSRNTDDQQMWLFRNQYHLLNLRNHRQCLFQVDPVWLNSDHLK